MSPKRALVRPALPSDAEGIARVHITSSDDSYAPLAVRWPAQDLAARTAHWELTLANAARGAPGVQLVALEQGQVVGFISGGPARRSEPPAALELYVVHVLPARRGLGIGGMLWRHACEALRGPALGAFYLDTLAELACCAFYDAHGGEVRSRNAGNFHGGNVTELIYFWPAGKSHV